MPRDYYPHEPKQRVHYLVRRTWPKHQTLPPDLEAIKQTLINKPRIKEQECNTTFS